MSWWLGALPIHGFNLQVRRRQAVTRQSTQPITPDPCCIANTGWAVHPTAIMNQISGVVQGPPLNGKPLLVLSQTTGPSHARVSREVSPFIVEPLNKWHVEQSCGMVLGCPRGDPASWPFVTALAPSLCSREIQSLHEQAHIFTC